MSYWSISDQPELFNHRDAFRGLAMVDDSPPARAAGLDVLDPIVEVEELSAAPAGETLHDFVKFRVGLHRAVFIGKHEVVELCEKREVPADVADGQVVGVRENVERHLRVAQPAVQRNHRRNFREDVREELRELVDAAFEAAEAPDCLEEFLPADVPGLVSIKQGRVVEKSLHGVGFGGAPPGNSPRGDAVIEVNQDLAQIEDDGVGLAHDNFNSVLPSSALLNVSSSAYSSPLPAGRPWAMRVTLMARAARRLAR